MGGKAERKTLVTREASPDMVSYIHVVKGSSGRKPVTSIRRARNKVSLAAKRPSKRPAPVETAPTKESAPTETAPANEAWSSTTESKTESKTEKE